MKIVIDVPEERYKDIQRIAEVQLDRRTDTVEQIVAKGTPIEKTDGDLTLPPFESGGVIYSQKLYPVGSDYSKEKIVAEKTDGDLISRDYTIQQIQKAKESNYNFNYNTLIDFIKVLPSANKTDGDLISRQALINYVKARDNDGYFENETKKVIKIIEQMPSAEKTAEWINQTDDDLAINDYQCSKCDYWTEYNTKYCPNCGCKMKGAEE